MTRTKPCPDCWVEAQRREAAYGEDPGTAYAGALTLCPMLHDTTPLPAGVGNPFDTIRSDP